MTISTYPEREIALTGGAFRFDPFRRVQVWVPDTSSQTSCAFDDPAPAKKPQKDRRVRRVVPCPDCGCDKTLKAARCQRCAALMRSSKHGTDGGYQSHLRRKESPCDPCSAAHLATVRANNARRETDPDRSPICGCGETKSPTSLRCRKCANEHRVTITNLEKRDAA